MNFVVLTETNGQRLFVNPLRIDYCRPDGERTYLHVGGCEFPLEIRETPEEVLRRMKSIGNGQFGFRLVEGVEEPRF